MKQLGSALLFCFVLGSCSDKDEVTVRLSVQSIMVGTYSLNPSNPNLNNSAPFDKPIAIKFSSPVDANSLNGAIRLSRKDAASTIALTISLRDQNSSIVITPPDGLTPGTEYVLHVDGTISGLSGEKMAQNLSVAFRTIPLPLNVEAIVLNEIDVLAPMNVRDIDPNQLRLTISFSAPLNTETVNTNTIQIVAKESVPVEFTILDETTVLVNTSQPVEDWTRFQIRISDQIRGRNGEATQVLLRTFYTGDNNMPDFPVISDDALLSLVQQQTFKYFWDFRHPASGMARERNSSGDLVTSGGSGFGLMAMIVAMERGFISRNEGITQVERIITFLEGADRFHGAWSHWINGNTGNVIPFSTNDNGGDLVETALLVQGLITVRQYLDQSNPTEQNLASRINTLWESVEWDWYTRGGQQVLYWHWSPDKEWTMNLPIRGHNETLIAYVLAAASPTHGIDANVYHDGYARNGGIKNGRSFYNIELPLGEDYGGPLFFSHYSFLGLDPRNLSDAYASYWTQNRNHTLINRQYAIANPRNYVGYTPQSWGLTASDNNTGYSAHSPTNDLGVITPTAAISSMPYTPEESIEALRFFYYSLGDRLWGEYGFYDAYNITAGWTADSYLAIDQGPIVIMIENYRTGLLWDLFMSAPEIRNGLDKLGFTY